MQVLSALKRSSKTLPQIMSNIEFYQKILINVKVSPNFDWKEKVAIIAEKKEIEQELGNEGRILIRASGTEALVRIMVETKSLSLSQRMGRRIAEKFSLDY